MVTHKLPYRSELYVAAAPRSTIRVPRPTHMGIAAGTIHLSITHQWPGNDGVRHVLLDTGAGTTRNRQLLEKTMGNVLRLMVTDTKGNQKWRGVWVGASTMPGSGTFSPGYSEITVTWNRGIIELYLDGVKSTLGGGTGTGILSAGGAQIFFGTTLTGASGANSTFGSVTIRGGVMTATEVMAWTTGRHLTYAPTRSALSAPWNGAAFRDRTPTLDWSGSRGAIRYQVRVSSYVSLRRPVRDVVLARTAYTTPTALVAGKTYYWRVRALDEYGTGTWSPVRRFTVRK